MKKVSKLSLFLFLLVAFFSTMYAQSDCPDGPAYPHAEFEFTSLEDLKSRVRQFEKSLSEIEKSQGVIEVFGGSHSRINEIDTMKKTVDGLITLSKGQYNSKIVVGEGGYRTRASFVFSIRPAPCSDHYRPVADLSIENVVFEGFTPDTTVRQSSDELYNAAMERAETYCTPASRAVGACNEQTPADVFVLIDTSGTVVLAKAVSGHPLLHAAAVASVRKWKFSPIKQGGKIFNRSGVITVRFKEPKSESY